MTKVIPFEFEKFQVRAVVVSGEPWFVAADVCAALGLPDTHKAIARLDDDEKGRNSILTPGGQQDMSVVNESGLYNLVLGSRKPEARRFKKWVTAEVLPSIRKTGTYLPANAMMDTLPPAIASQIGGIIKVVVHKQLEAILSAELPRLIEGQLAKKQVGVRYGVTAGQVWSLHKLGKLKNGPQCLSRLLSTFGCQIDGAGKSEQGGRTAKIFDPDKADRAMKSGLLAHCQQYIQERTGQGALFAVKR